MPAPLQNQFWKLRSSHGRKTLFASPQLLWEAACEYFEWCDANPLIEIDFKGKDATEVKMPKMRAYTLIGLAHYLDCSESWFREFKRNLKKGGKGKDFLAIITRIEEVIYNQKFTGAAANMLNPNIIARDLGLRDKTETELTGKDGNPIETEQKIKVSFNLD